MSHVVSICHTPAGVERRPADHYARVVVSEAVLVEGHGIEGDAKGGSDKRQLNVMTAETMAQLRAEGFLTGPGELGEQLVVAGVDETALTPGTRLALGEMAVIEVTLPRTGCDRFEHIQGKPKLSAKGRLGVLARVVASGVVRTGDAVRLPG
ncbi:MAG TPA: MOSC domain-containing protein [Fimbriiglobus sp.]|jgi:MOSC domain-containing protein YiiM|nr:MOSC domain-containing protein [Fimbriiglobus sp.]